VKTFLSTSRLWSQIKRSFVIAKREHLTQDDVNALRDNQQRVSLIISARWLIILLFVAFSVCGATIFLINSSPISFLNSIIIPLNALIFVVVYNFIFARLNTRLANLAVASMLQLVFDVLVVAVLVYYSGGVESWFWVVNLLILVAAALIAQQPGKIWALAITMCAILLAVEWAEYFRIIPYHQLAFASGVDWNSWRFVMMRSLWQVFMILGTALIASNGITWLLNLVSFSRESQLIDVRTGLYSREYLQRTLEIEANRAMRAGRALHLVLIDIDHFGAINTRFGIETGDRIITQLAKVLSSELSSFDNGEPSANIAARISGEEFALLLVERLGAETDDLSVKQVAEFAEELRARIARTDFEGVSITVSLGLASLPTDTLDVVGLRERADEALTQALQEGGNRVCVPRVRELEVAFSSEFKL